jgi:nitrite reductase/ring-hydroxylating ferredoxin subunit
MTALEKIGSPPTRLDSTALYDWDYLVQEERAHRLIYTDPVIFEAEMTNIFGGTWTYLAHESEIPHENDFITRRMGSRPLIIVRDGAGKIRALYNRCTHRGTTLCRWDKGNTKSFQCPYHGWNFLNTGRLRGVPWPEGYAEDMRDPNRGPRILSGWRRTSTRARWARGASSRSCRTTGCARWPRAWPSTSRGSSPSRISPNASSRASRSATPRNRWR